MFCGKCGAKLEENSKFCGGCGNQVGASNSLSKEVNVQIINKPKKVINKKKFFGLIITLLLLIIVIGGGFLGLKYIQDINSADRLIDNFNEIIKNQDFEELKKLINLNESTSEIKEDDLKFLMNYYKENNKTLKADIEQLRKSLESDKKTELPYYVVCEEGVLFDKCSIKLAVRELKVESTLEDVKVTLYRENQIIKDEIKFNELISNLAPGVYEIHITSLNELTPFTLVEEVDLFKSESSVNLKIENNLNENKIISSEKEAIIFINGKNTKKTATELGTLIGLEDGTEIYGVFKLNDQEIKSNVFTVYGNGDVELDYDYETPPTAKEAEIEIKYIISEYLRNFATAVNYDRFSVIKPYLLENSELYQQQKSYISDLYDREIKEEYLMHEILEFTYDETTLKGTVKVEESYRIEKVLEDKISDATYESLYEFIYDESSEKFMLTKLIGLS